MACLAALSLKALKISTATSIKIYKNDFQFYSAAVLCF
jgi:hypothetical protein